MPEVKVLGKSVTIRDRFPASKFYPLHAAMRWFSEGHRLGERSFKEDIAAYVDTVTAWDFPGDPATLDGWGELDVITELPPVVGAVNDHIAQMITDIMDGTKNSGQPPISP